MDEDIQEIEQDSFFVPNYKDASSYTQDVLRSILTATKSANDLPSAGDDFDCYNCYPGFREVLFHKRKSILSLMTSIIQSHGMREKFQDRELEEKFDLLVEANDTILENVSIYLDEASGPKKSDEELLLAVKPPSAINTSWNKKQFSSSSPQSYKLLTAKNVSRPQLSFKDKVENTNTPFVPIIREKPHSIKPLAITYEADKDEYCHPYEWEIEKFQPQEELFEEVEPVLPKPLDETPLVIVKTEEQLKKMCDELSKVNEIAVDLEHHSYRSFQGFTCLMQISTRETDYIVDALELRSEMYILNEVFTNPKIVKVLHGADMDVLWLQRDFGIYIVNLFDTGQAARVLHFAHLSLAYLLKHYCRFDVDKRFQLADWRIRPLPAEMIKYAREDTHYLLYVYDCLKNDLIAAGNDMKNLLQSTFDRSKVICAKKYQKPLFDDDKYLELYKKNKKMFNAKQLYCLKELFEWRDSIARENDESIAYVLPNHMMLQIAEALPREQQGILACCNPIPPLVKQQLNELHSIILRANDSSLKQLEQLELQQKAQVQKKIHHQIDLSSFIHCPHDIHHLEDKEVKSADQSGNAENLLPLITKMHSSTSLLKKKPILSALFEKSPKQIPSNNVQKIPETVVNSLKHLISPYERFKITEKIQNKDSSAEQKEVKKVEEKENNSEVEVANEPVNTTVDVEENSKPSEKANASGETSTADASFDVMESIPLRKKKRNKKRKHVPDVSLVVTPKERPPPRKKSRTPEASTVADESFTPYDYSKSELSNFSGKKPKNKTPQGKNQAAKGYFGRKRKNSKQATFARGSGNDHKPKWPKNK
ncbi:Exosome component 10 [Araneus ventricosus]|uniref:Exosome complex component 10 homolog n=1 Tax=Araneus ventricosus TaxID=182803 RepID=A0A4Y2GUB0_ARAVE|nr:Exosome component 10 [Araneus ventricosus]